jgi:hypothetical protein
MRGTLFMVLVGVCALAAPASARGVSRAQMVRVINQERTANGIPPVTEDSGLSAGCAAHDNYERLNGNPGAGYDIRGENPSKPGYSVAGSRASHDSVLAAGTRSSSHLFANDDFARGDVFDNAPEHLISLMDPAVAVIGAAQISFNLSPYGTVYVSCVNVRSAAARKRPRGLHLYSYFGPHGLAPASVEYVEGPTANTVSGPTLFFYFFGPVKTNVTLRSLTVIGPGGKRVPHRSTLSGGLRSPSTSARIAKLAGSPTHSPAVMVSVIPSPTLGNLDVKMRTSAGDFSSAGQGEQLNQ